MIEAHEADIMRRSIMNKQTMANLQADAHADALDLGKVWVIGAGSRELPVPIVPMQSAVLW